MSYQNQTNLEGKEAKVEGGFNLAGLAGLGGSGGVGGLGLNAAFSMAFQKYDRDGSGFLDQN